ncbi:MAG: zinc-ribbon domain-containing protein [Magnetococcus sp. DMHC-6]
MIVQCGNCNTQFDVNPDILGETGRKLKCSNCKTIFFQPPPSKTPEEPLEEEPLKEEAFPEDMEDSDKTQLFDSSEEEEEEKEEEEEESWGTSPDDLEEIDLDDEPIAGMLEADEEEMGDDEFSEAATALANYSEPDEKEEEEEEYVSDVATELAAYTKPTQGKTTVRESFLPTKAMDFDQLEIPQRSTTTRKQQEVDHEKWEEEEIGEASHVEQLVDDDPPARPPRKTTGKWIWRVIVGLLLILAGGIVSQTDWWEFKKYDMSHSFRLISVDGEWRTRDIGTLLLIKGTLLNTSKTTRSMPQIRVLLLNDKNATVTEALIIPGRVLTEKDLESSEEGLRSMVGLQRNIDRIKVPKAWPEKEVPFQAVFINPPEAAIRFQVDFEEIGGK